MTSIPCIGGIDVGLSVIDRTSGVCRVSGSELVLDHTYSDKLSRSHALRVGTASFNVLAIDGPVLPSLHYDERPCEKVFVWSPFQRRCKPGESHIPGTGQALRRSGCDTADQWSTRVLGIPCGAAFPQVHPERNVVEAFPNGFLGVMLPDNSFGWHTSRGEKFDRLYDQCRADGSWIRLRKLLPEAHQVLWDALDQEQNHDRRAALICVLTGLGVWAGKYVAVGEPAGGYFFFPPWELWAQWAREGLQQNRKDLRLTRPVDVWIDGHRTLASEALLTKSS